MGRSKEAQERRREARGGRDRANKEGNPAYEFTANLDPEDPYLVLKPIHGRPHSSLTIFLQVFLELAILGQPVFFLSPPHSRFHPIQTH